MDKKLDDVYVFLMEQILRQLKQETKEKFAEHDVDLTIDQWVILKRIREIVHPTQIQLAESTFKDPASVTRILDVLENKDYLKRYVIENNRRTNLIELLPKGYDTVETVLPMAENIRAKGLKNLTEKEQADFLRILKKIQSSLE